MVVSKMSKREREATTHELYLRQTSENKESVCKNNEMSQRLEKIRRK
jgi:hypothetical protein